MSEIKSPFRGTTIVAVQRNGKIAIAGDGQVTMGEHTIMKMGAKKVRRIYGDRVVVGFAGSVADAFALSEKFEGYLEQFAGNLPRAAVELAQTWRQDNAMRKLEAMLLAADKENLLLISGTGEVIAPDDGVLAIGRRARPRAQHRYGGQGHRARRDGDRRRHLRVYQRPHHRGGSVV